MTQKEMVVVWESEEGDPTSPLCCTPLAMVIPSNTTGVDSVSFDYTQGGIPNLKNGFLGSIAVFLN